MGYKRYSNEKNKLICKFCVLDIGLLAMKNGGVINLGLILEG